MTWVLQYIHVFFPSNNNKANKSFFDVLVQPDKSSYMIGSTDTGTFITTNWEGQLFYFQAPYDRNK